MRSCGGRERKPTVILWKKRYAAEGIGGLEDRPRPGKPRTTDDVAIVRATLEPHPHGQSSDRCNCVHAARLRGPASEWPGRPDHLDANRLGSDRGQLQEAIHF